MRHPTKGLRRPEVVPNSAQECPWGTNRVEQCNGVERPLRRRSMRRRCSAWVGEERKKKEEERVTRMSMSLSDSEGGMRESGGQRVADLQACRRDAKTTCQTQGVNDSRCSSERQPALPQHPQHSLSRRQKNANIFQAGLSPQSSWNLRERCELQRVRHCSCDGGPVT